MCHKPAPHSGRNVRELDEIELNSDGMYDKNEQRASFRRRYHRFFGSSQLKHFAFS